MKKRLAVVTLLSPLFWLIIAVLSATSSHTQHWWSWQSRSRASTLIALASAISGVYAHRSGLLAILHQRYPEIHPRTALATLTAVVSVLVLRQLLGRRQGSRNSGGNSSMPPPPLPSHIESGAGTGDMVTALPSVGTVASSDSWDSSDPGDLSDGAIRRFLSLVVFREQIGREFLSALLAHTRPYELQHFAAGDTVIRGGCQCDGLSLIYSGTVQLIDQDACLTELGHGTCIGLIQLLSETACFPLSYRASTDCCVVFVGREAVQEIWEQDVGTLLTLVRGAVTYQWRLASFVFNDFLHVETPRSSTIDTNILRHPSLQTDGDPRNPQHSSTFGNLSSLDIAPPPTRGIDIGRALNSPIPSQSQSSLKRSRAGGSLNTLSASEPCPAALSPPHEPPRDLTSPMSRLNRVRPLLFEITLGEGEHLYSFGARADQFFIVLSGRIELRRDGWTRICETGDVVGAVAFFADSPHYVDAVCTDRTRVLCVEESHMARLVSEHPEVMLAVLLCVSRVFAEEILPFERYGLQRMFRRAGHVLYTEGSSVNNVYIVVRGRVRLARRPQPHSSLAWLIRERRRVHSTNAQATQQPFETFDIGRSDTVGEIAMFAEQKTWVSTAVCIRDTELVAVSGAAFALVCQKFPGAMLKFSRAMTNRLYWTSLHPSASVRGLENVCTVCVVPLAGTGGQDLGLVMSHLAKALEMMGSTDKVAPIPVADNPVEIARFAASVAAKQERFRYILLQADPWASPWSRLCVANADCILLVASAGANPAVGRAERELLWAAAPSHTFLQSRGLSGAMGVHKELVVVHRQVSTHPLPNGTAAWLAARPSLSHHHHVRLQVQDDYDRVGRHLTGRSVGLVLGGGGARAMAHLGVLAGIKDADIPIDYIGGTGQGALIAALYATSLDTNIATSSALEFAAALGSMAGMAWDATIPILSKFTGRRFSELMKTTLGESTDIADLWVDFYSVCTNLTSVGIEVCDSGSLWQAVRASNTAIGLVPPMNTPNGLLVDGGYSNNLPADVMRERVGDGLVIASSVQCSMNDKFEHVTPYQNGSISGFHLMFTRLASALVATPCQLLRISNPFERHMPSFTELKSQLTFLTHQVQLRKSVARCIDFYIESSPPRHEFFDKRSFETVIHEALLHTQHQLAVWQEEATNVMLDELADHTAAAISSSVHRSISSPWLRGVWNPSVPRANVSILSLIMNEDAMTGAAPPETQQDNTASILRPLFVYRNRWWRESNIKIGSTADMISRSQYSD